MARNTGIAISSSRFACLKIEDDDEGDDQTKAKAVAQQGNSNASKKKNKKKKDGKEKEQLKQMAFGGKNAGGAAKNQSNPRRGAGDGGDERTDWNEWKQHDTELMEEQFKDDLAAALLQSRLEQEQKEQETKRQKERIEAGLEPPPSREGRKKKKQKEKPQPMSLEQFNQLPPEKPANTSDDSEGETNGKESSEPSVQTRVPATQQDSRFFNSVDNDAEQILRQEKMQEEYRKHYASDNAVVAKLKNDLERKDLKVRELTEKMNAMEAELKQVKKRNKQLCVILAQGEMKDKAQVLLQVDELTGMRDELTEQVTSLTAELEKEKSKNHAMKAELDKLKNNKHGK